MVSCFFFFCRCSHSIRLCCPFVPLHPNAFGNHPLRGNVKGCKLIFVDSKRPICFPYAWLHRRRNWWGKAAVFTSGVMDWVTACRPRMAQLWKGPLCSPLRLQLLCTTERCFTSDLWTGPSASTPYPEPFFLWAFLYSTSSTGSLIKCCDTRTSTQICKTLPANFSCYLHILFSFSEPKLPVRSTVKWRNVSRSICFLKLLLKTLCSGASSGSQMKSGKKETHVWAAWSEAGVCDSPLVTVLVWFVRITTETNHCWYLSREVDVDQTETYWLEFWH